MRPLILLLSLTLMIPVGAGLSLSPELQTPGCTDALVRDVFDTPELRSDALFARLFPAATMVVTHDRSRLPEIPVLWAHGTSGACALDDLPVALQRTGRSLDNAADLEAAAWIIAQTTDEDVVGVLDHVETTSFTPTAEGAIVTFLSKSPATGTLVDWDVTVAADGSGDARWTVRSIEPGLRTGVEGWFIGPGDTGPFEPMDVGSEAVLTKLYPTHDGKNVRITYNTNNYVSLAAAEADADRNGNGGVFAYNTMNLDWGFPSADNDGFMDITMDGCACIFGGNNVNIHMPPNVLAWIHSIGLGLDYPSEEATAALIVAHEFFHHFQYSIMQWNQANWVVEGMARFSETILHAATTHQPLSLTYHPSINGFTYMMSNPHLAPQSNSYSYGLAWGHIYDTNGGVEVLLRVLEESKIDSGFPGFIDRALAATAGDHDTFADATRDLGVRMLTRSFEWSTWDNSESYDWGLYLPNAPQVLPTTAAGLVKTYSSAPPANFGFRFVNMSVPAAPLPATVMTVEGPTDVEFLLVSGGTVTPMLPLSVDPLPADRLVIVYHNQNAAGTGNNVAIRSVS